MAPRLSSSIDLKPLDSAPLFRDEDDEDEFELELRRASLELGGAAGAAKGSRFAWAAAAARNWDKKTVAIVALSAALLLSLGRGVISSGRAAGSAPWPAGLASSAGLVEDTTRLGSTAAFGSAIEAGKAAKVDVKERLPDWVDPKVPMVDFENLEGPFDTRPLAALCAGTEWVPGRFIASDDDQGGIGNIRNTVLTQLRYAITAGAGFVQPSFMIRSPVVTADLEELHRGGRAGMSFFFDYSFFKQTMKEVCPGLVIVDDIYHVPHVEKAAFPELLNPPDLRELATGNPRTPRPPPGIQNMDIPTWRDDFDSYYGKPDPNQPSIHRLTRPLFQYPVDSDPAALWTQFGRVLKLHPVAQVLASQITHELEKRFESYFGSHLRLEKDVGSAWGGFEEQASVHLAQFLARGAAGDKAVYVACGDPDPLERFKKYLSQKAHHMQMLTKQSLLARRPKALAKLNSLHFDQQALVDYLILSRSAYLVGNAESSFSTNLALRRHLLATGAQLKDQEVWRGGEDDKSYLMRPEKSGFIRDTSWP